MEKLCASEKVDLFDLTLWLLGFSMGLAKAIFSATCGAFSKIFVSFVSYPGEKQFEK